jgi:hypothetical protein
MEFGDVVGAVVVGNFLTFVGAVVLEAIHRTFNESRRSRRSRAEQAGRVAAAKKFGGRTVMLALLLSAAVVTRGAQKIVLCGTNCGTPMPTFTYRAAASPLNVPVKFGGVVKCSNATCWLWLKAGEPAIPCTAAQKKDGNAYQEACSVPIGAPLYTTFPIRVTGE